MKKITYEEKLKIVKENEERYGYGYFSKKYNVNEITIRNWIDSYRVLGEKGLKKRMRNNSYSTNIRYGLFFILGD